ncbi:hypothetical protein TWF225_006535 [Orbilia oligospora]|nr:hypothetical protein TWF225_006535 [Orbilia oligospora]KAF3265049.1 hypothetical protein TWF217_002698 [Orbilia oligospora]KAF3268078.1 hypothetical protein TWF128_008092 [Orbilia oligospora]
MYMLGIILLGNSHERYLSLPLSNPYMMHPVESLSGTSSSACASEDWAGMQSMQCHVGTCSFELYGVPPIRPLKELPCHASPSPEPLPAFVCSPVQVVLS